MLRACVWAWVRGLSCGGGAGWAWRLGQVRRNRWVEIIPISVGCLGSCTYCKTKHARGHLGSYPIPTLVHYPPPAHEAAVFGCRRAPAHFLPPCRCTLSVVLSVLEQS